jgi:hypothetical protein
LFGHSDRTDTQGMATLQQKIQAEVKMRGLIEEHGLPEPDAIEYGHTCIRVFWHETKTVLVIDIDDPPQGWENLGERL